jgi:very-short-patch-repair endonuclease
MSSSHRNVNPSPFAGEGAERTRCVSEAGEGAGARNPSSGRSLRSRPPSPARGEGRNNGSVPKAIRRGKSVLRARGLRSRMTDAERKLWFLLRDRRLGQTKFRRQVPIGPYIVDFLCFESRLAIEFDGGQHAEPIPDKKRDRWFAANGFRILRFWNNDVLSNPEGVYATIAAALSRENPSPLAGEGAERTRSVSEAGEGPAKEEGRTGLEIAR